MSRASSLIAEMDAIERAWSVLHRSGPGNPHHDAEGKFTSAGGEGGSHAHRLARKRRKLRRLKRRIKRQHAALKARHTSERRELAARQRERHAAHNTRYGARISKAKARKALVLQKADARHEREIASMERRRERERSKEGNANPEDVAKWEAQHARDVESARQFYRESERPAHERMAEFDVGAVRAEREQAAVELRGRHARQRKGMLRRQREERVEFREQAREEWQGHGGKLKSESGFARGAIGGDRGEARSDLGVSAGITGVRDAGDERVRRLSPSRTHKASSAEAILKHCLRSLGLTAGYRRGELTARQTLELLDAIREYARGWMHHEAEGLIRQYGVPTERSLSASMRRHVGRFFDRARNFVREAILAGAMALSGPGELTHDDLDEVDRAASVQVGFLDQFEADVASRTPVELAEPSGLALAKPMTAAQFAARAELYGNAVWSSAGNLGRRHAILSGRFAQERRLHYREVDHPCTTCAEESAKGWVPIGTLRPIGDSECLGNMCDCYFEFRGPMAA